MHARTRERRRHRARPRHRAGGDHDHGRRAKLRQVVFNLVSNAVKFTPSGRSRRHLRPRSRTAASRSPSPTPAPASRPRTRRRIFEEFQQAGDGKQAEGTGLGLPLSGKLVELHGGRLWVESELGKGSTFRFTLPVRQEVP